MNLNNNHIVFAPLPPGCTHIIHGPTAIHAINALGHLPYRWDPTHPTNGYTGCWIPALPRAPAPAPVYARAMPFPVPHAGFIRQDWLHPPRDRIPPIISQDTNQPPVRVLNPRWGDEEEEPVPARYGRFALYNDGSYRLQAENVQPAPAKEEGEWEEWKDGDVDWEQVNRWKELAAVGRRGRGSGGLVSEEERRLHGPERALSERSWPESEVTDPELVERAERRRREREG